MTDEISLKQMIKSIKSADEYFEISKHYSKMSQDASILFFIEFYKNIPDAFLYEIYVKILCDKRRFKFSNQLFKTDLYEKISNLSKDKKISQLLLPYTDEKGFLTVYRGQTKSSTRTAMSWTLKKQYAMWFGKRHAVLDRCDSYIIFSGKVKSDDVAIYITEKNEEEIVIPSKYVINKKREIFEFKEF